MAAEAAPEAAPASDPAGEGSEVVMRLLRTFLLDRSGATAVEYCLIAVMISVAVVGGLRAFTGELNNTFTIVGDGLDGP